MFFRFKDYYSQMGYRFNPFQGLTPDEFCLAFPLPENFYPELSQPFQVIQIVAGGGCGKTSLLRQINFYFTKQGKRPFYHYVRNSNDLLDDVPADCRRLLLDEAQRLRKNVFLKKLPEWLKSGIRIILGSHMDHRLWFAGKYSLTTIYLSDKFKSLLPEIIKKRLDFASVSKPLHFFTPEALDLLAEESGGSMEAARAIGYEIFLQLPPSGAIDVKAVKTAAEKLKPSCEKKISRF